MMLITSVLLRNATKAWFCKFSSHISCILAIVAGINEVEHTTFNFDLLTFKMIVSDITNLPKTSKVYFIDRF